MLILCKLWLPIFATRPWQTPFPALAVLMPKTAVQKDHFPSSRKHQIGFARQILAMKAKTVAKTMCQAAEENFRSCVFRPDSSHVVTAALRAELIHFAILHCNGSLHVRELSPLSTFILDDG